jgi:diguanylate cyclase (GGDEF)-like protein
MTNSLEYPTGPVALDSQFYVPRPPIEAQAYQEITKPGSLIRIKAPKEMGKSSLMLRISHYARSLGYHIAAINCQQIDTANLNNAAKFFRALCVQVSHALNLKPNLDEYWDDDLGNNLNCTLYFQYELLENLDRPLVLCINELTRIFEYTELAQEFLPLLRSWFEEGKQIEAWGKLRLVVVYSTEVYVPLKINQSPFNIGVPLTLPEFTAAQVEDLAKLHGLACNSHKIQQLIDMVGGHPHLIRLALYHLASSPDVTLETILESAPTDTGIYREHLRRHLATLEKNRDLSLVFTQILTGKSVETMNPILTYKLESLGLIKKNKEQFMVSCYLYRIYFNKFLSEDYCGNDLSIQDQNQILRNRLLELEKLQEEFKKISQIDALTLVANRRYFQEYLQEQWQKLAKSRSVLSVIFCDLDNFKTYNDSWGHQFGDDCLKKVAEVLQKNVHRQEDMVARYGGDEFVIILPNTNANQSLLIAHKIRTDVENLKMIASKNSQKTQVTVSLGIASTIPDLSHVPEILIGAADEALYESKKANRNCVSLSTLFNFGAEIHS